MAVGVFRDIPPVPLALGLGGLVPFWGLAVALAAGGAFGVGPGTIDQALATYAAIIISFLGGIRWGLAVRGGADRQDYVISVVPSLAAWALMALAEPWRLGLDGLLVLIWGPVDLRLLRGGLAPPWFGRLRLILSTGAGVALLGSAFAAR